jgi:hypothetical protein
MMEHYDIDGLVQYGSEEIPGTTQVVNPAWRALDKALREVRGRIRKLHAELGAQTFRDEALDLERQAERLQNIQNLQAEAANLRQQRRQTPRKVALASLPESDRPSQLRPLGKLFTDTIKRIAYRAEPALVGLLRPHLAKEEEARALLRELFVSSADLDPNEQDNSMTIRVHRMSCPAHDKAVAALFDDLNQADFRHPETGMRLIYRLA